MLLHRRLIRDLLAERRPPGPDDEELHAGDERGRRGGLLRVHVLARGLETRMNFSFCESQNFHQIGHEK